MIDQKFGHKELYEVVLRAKSPMYFGERRIEADEPVLYFNSIQVAAINEPNQPVFARGGWGNMPRVVWDTRSEVIFQMTEGVISNVGMGLLLGAKVLTKTQSEPIYIHIKEGPKKCSVNNIMDIKHWPVLYPIKKAFVYEYEYDAIQKALYGKLNRDAGEDFPRIALFYDKECKIPAKNTKEYVIDYYYEYRDEAIIYSLGKERLNGYFSLEGKFYSTDENEGYNYTNLLFMPKVKVVGNIDLRLGERVDPAVSTFTMIGMPERVGDNEHVICEITRLNENIDADI